MMLVNERKLALAGWLQAHDAHAYSRQLQLQMFLFFEAMNLEADEEADFEHLYGCSNGPTFARVLDAIQNNAAQFAKEARQLMKE